MFESQRVIINEASQAATARRVAMDASKALGFSETDAGRAAVVASELASNLIKHTPGGEFVATHLRSDAGENGLQLLSIDKGPGMTDPDRCMEDGFSTKGSPGNGMGAVRRMSEDFDLYTDRRGTVIQARLWPRDSSSRRVRSSRHLKLSGLSVPVHGETQCGDAWTICPLQDHARIFVVDGLGHGPNAAQAAKVGVTAFEKSSNRDLPNLADDIHTAMFQTRGGAAALIDVNFIRSEVTFLGVGNISGVIVSDRQRSLASMNGTMGSGQIIIRPFSYPWGAKHILILHSDGVNTHWKLGDYPGLAGRDPAVIAGVLYRDHQRGRDDATVVVAIMQDAER